MQTGMRNSRGACLKAQ